MNSSEATPAIQGNSPILIDSLEFAAWTIVPIFLSYIVLSGTSGLIVRKTLKYANIDLNEYESEKDTGTVVGKIENVLVLTLMLLEAYTALGVIFAAKSIVRRADIDTGDTTYYLTGTLTNFTYSVILGVLLHITLIFIMRL